MGQEEQAQVGVQRPEPLGGDQAAVRLRGHPDVEDRHVRVRAAQQLDQRVTVRDAADDLVAGGLQQHEQPLAEQGAVLGQRYPHGILTSIVPTSESPAVPTSPPRP